MRAQNNEMLFDFISLFQDIKRVKVTRNKKWIGYYEVFCAGLLSVLCNVPYLFAYDIVPCKEVHSTSTTATTKSSRIECWDYAQDPVRKTNLWIIYSYVAQVNL